MKNILILLSSVSLTFHASENLFFSLLDGMIVNFFYLAVWLIKLGEASLSEGR
jgi:hypothetical protein